MVIIRSLHRVLAKFSTNNHTILTDPPTTYNPYRLFSVNDLELKASRLISTSHLSPYTGPIDKLGQLLKFQGSTVGRNSNLIFSIPTALSKNETESASLRYYNVYYLLDTTSPMCTLTQKTFNHLKASYNGAFSCKIAGFTIRFYPSSIYQTKFNTPGWPLNVNILGMELLERFRGVRIQSDFQTLKSTLELIK